MFLLFVCVLDRFFVSNATKLQYYGEYLKLDFAGNTHGAHLVVAEESGLIRSGMGSK